MDVDAATLHPHPTPAPMCAVVALADTGTPLLQPLHPPVCDDACAWLNERVVSTHVRARKSTVGGGRRACAHPCAWCTAGTVMAAQGTQSCSPFVTAIGCRVS